MKSLSIVILHSAGSERIDDVTSFVGEDASGSFGILPGHARFMTVLGIGLAWFRAGRGERRYLALPGAVLYLERDTLTLATRRYLLGDDYTEISAALEQQLLAEERELAEIKSNLHRIEQQLLEQVSKLGHSDRYA